MGQLVAGVDGCRGGWLVVLVDGQGPPISSLQVRLCRKFEDILTISPSPAVIAADIPIGLLDSPKRGGRECDQQTRRLLGRRASSVFSPPSRIVLEAREYAEARRHGLSIQAFGILPKIREVDRLMSPELQGLVHESHPELAFTALVGHPMRSNKKTISGRHERLRALEQFAGQLFRRIGRTLSDASNGVSRRHVAPDDLVDASVLAWTALRIADGTAERIPPDPPLDRKGLRMEIWS